MEIKESPYSKLASAIIEQARIDTDYISKKDAGDIRWKKYGINMEAEKIYIQEFTESDWFELMCEMAQMSPSFAKKHIYNKK